MGVVATVACPRGSQLWEGGWPPVYSCLEEFHLAEETDRVVDTEGDTEA